MPKFEAGFGAVRDCYEAYVVYTFVALLVAVLEDGKGLADLIALLAVHVVEERRAVEEAVARGVRPPTEHLRPPFPCCYEYHKPSLVAKAWLYQCRLMAMQFVLFKPLLTLLPFVLRLGGIDFMGLPLVIEHSPNWRNPRVYVLFLQNLSVAVAFYGLLSFYHGTEKDLAWCDPWPKVGF